MAKLTKKWTDSAGKRLIGKRIVSVEYMTSKEINNLGWYKRPIILQLDDGNIIYPSMDDEGNNGGALFTNDQNLPTIPVFD